MKYVDFGKLGIKASRYGIGCSKLGRINNYDVDEEKNISLIRYAIDQGVNYLDTAYIYREGDDERAIGRALQGGYRQRVTITTKLPVWTTDVASDFEKHLDTQLKRLQVDYLDFYFFHGLNRDLWSKVQRLDLLHCLDKAKKDGKIRFTGFSFHDGVSVFKDILDSYNWDACQIQLNFLDEFYSAGVEGLRYAAAKGIPTVIMEPLKGGGIVTNVPPEAQKLFDEYPVKRPVAEWGLRWVANFPEATVILSGVTNQEQMKQNVDLFDLDLVNVMPEEELNLLRRIKEIYLKSIKISCTACGYCMPCPAGVDIPELFRYYNYAPTFYSVEVGEDYYAALTGRQADASFCTECGHCESMCTQGIQIIEGLKKVRAYLGKGR